MISRKPIPGASAAAVDRKAPDGPHESASRNTSQIPQDDPPAYDALAEEAPIEEGVPQPELEEQLEHLDLETEQLPHGPVLADESNIPGSQNPTTTTSGSSAEKPSKWKTALGVAYNEAKHFAGGLITHPYEATKHYSILRHSHGLVFYQGPSTSVAITIFSSQPLPANRTLWLQKRGFSGSTGLRIGASALGSRSAWINVTPAQTASPAQLRPADERAWQRDISRFLRKASSSSSSSAAARHLAAQRVRETNIVRIPHVAEDGYFRLVLCAGDRKVLCPSPVFRYASTSTDPGRVRGATLKTAPLELGIKLGAFVANQLGTTAAGNALAPVQNAVQPYELGGLTQAAAQGVYTASGAEDRVNAQLDAAGEKYDEKVEGEKEVLAGEDDGRGEVLEKHDGPVSPYPVRFSGAAGAAAEGDFGAGVAGVPTVRLAGAAEDVVRRLSGVYLAWAALQKPKSAKAAAAIQLQIYDSWIPALVAVAADRGGRADVVERQLVSVSLIHELDERTLVSCKLNVMVMAFLRPLLDRSGTEDGIAQFATDVATAQDVLSRPAWAAEDVLERTKSQASAKSLPERVASFREVGQRQVDRMQLHRYGLRMDSMEVRDQMVGVGGICVPR